MSRMGRNPFEKKSSPKNSATPAKPMRAVDVIREAEEVAKAAGVQFSDPDENWVGRLAQYVATEIPARSYVLGLKAYCLSVSLFD